MQSKQLNITTSGATAVSVLLYSQCSELGGRSKRTLFVANVGDARAVLVTSKNPAASAASIEVKKSGFFATRLTFDHKAEDHAEQERIKAAGANVLSYRLQGLIVTCTLTTIGGFCTRNRVLGILAVSRSFGDHGMKDFVIGNPKFIPFLSTDKVFIMRCSDALCLRD